jgi:branched-chain amino acid transport system permease protein
MDSLLYTGSAALSLGTAYGVVALGFVVVFKASGVLNFAHGSLALVGGLVMASLVTDQALGLAFLAGRNPLAAMADTFWGWGLNLLLAMGLAAVVGLAAERLAARPMRNAPQFATLVVTIGVSVVITTFARNAPVPRGLRVPWSTDAVSVLGAAIPVSYLATVVIGAVTFTAVLAFYRSPFGVATRAVASDAEAAAAQGIDTARVRAVAWALAAALATVAAMVWSFSPRGLGAINPSQLPDLTFRALPVLVVGGLDSASGALIGGLAIGAIEVLAGQYLSGQIGLLGAGYQQIVPYLVMVAVLYVRPYGLRGTPAVRRV